MDLRHHAIEHATITASAAIAKGAGVTAAASGVAHQVASTPEIITLADMGIVVGIFGVLVGSGTNLFFQYRKDRRETVLHNKRMESIRDEIQ